MELAVNIWLRNDEGASTFTYTDGLPKGTRFVLLQILKPGASVWTPGTRYSKQEATVLIERAIALGKAPANGYRLVPAPAQANESTIARLRQLRENRKRKEAEEANAE